MKTNIFWLCIEKIYMGMGDFIIIRGVRKILLVAA